MLPLSQDYIEQLEAIAGSIQESEQLAQYMESEEEEDYKVLQQMYEPILAELHLEVAKNDPLQLIAFEKVLLDPAFEGLFLPKILSYSILRGEVSTHDCKYTRQQDHFKDILTSIIQSPNFEWLKKRIGMTVQTGFMLSSDIWITNLINVFQNKRFRYYLQSSKVDKFRFESERRLHWERYKKQFNNEIYFTADFPTQLSELKVLYPSVKEFIFQRVSRHLDNSSFVPQMKEFIENKSFWGHPEHVEMLGMYANYFELDQDETNRLSEILNSQRKEVANFNEVYFNWLLEALTSNAAVDSDCDLRVAKVLDKNVKDDLASYYELTELIALKGYADEDAIDAVRVFHNNYEGLSTINQCVRYMILSKIRRFMGQLQPLQYHDYFEGNKTFTAYMHSFGNQKFNQDIEDISLVFINKSLKKFTDKRSHDYQKIKKFVATAFVEMGFLNDKEIVEMFKSRRKKKD
ncbi:MAG: hypothetical protein ACOYOA_14880 [Saprospiraceae bacterium]